MKKTIWVLVLFLLSISLAATLECQVAQECTPEQSLVLCLSDETNAHAELPTGFGEQYTCDNYDWKVCCSESYLDAECKGEYDTVAYINEITNSHASIEKDVENGYTIPVCLSGLRGAECGTSSSGGKSCVFSMSDEKNAHMGTCESYDTKIYCAINSDNDEDGYPANVDCDDDNDQIHPEQTEIGDGVDNDCDGLIDGDDPDSTLPEGWYQLSEASGYSDFSEGGIILEELASADSIFRTTDGSKHALVSKKVNVQPDKTYFASLESSCSATLQLVYDETLAEEEEDVGFFAGIFFGADLVNSVEGVDKIEINVSSNQAKFARLLVVVEGNDCTISKPQLELKSKGTAAPYNDVHKPFPLATELNPLPAASCCQELSCWNGYSCIDNMRDNTFLVENVSGDAVYRCVDGIWIFRAMLYDWNAQKTGSCAEESQCFVLSTLEGGDPQAAKVTSEEFAAGTYPICLNDGEYLFDHYCNNGNWSSRTNFLASTLLEFAEKQDEYTLFCAPYDDALLSLDGKDVLIAGDNIVTIESTSGDSLLGEETTESKEVKTCFQAQKDPEGNRLLSESDNSCVNNVCLLRYGSGDNFNLAFATSLNKPAENVDSFIAALGVDPTGIPTSCEGDSLFNQCSIGSGELWYSSQLNAIIYDKAGIALEGTFFGNIAEAISNFFGGFFGDEEEVADSKEFIEQTQNYRDVYLLKTEDKAVRAFKESLPEQEKLVAEYENFAIPICKFVENSALPSEEGKTLLLQVAGSSPISCIMANNTQRIESVSDVDHLWPQLTGVLRPQK
jgi:hypothetical protein